MPEEPMVPSESEPSHSDVSTSTPTRVRPTRQDGSPPAQEDAHATAPTASGSDPETTSNDMSPNDNATPEDASPDDHPTPETTPSAQSATPTDNPESTPEKPSEESPDLTPPAASGSESAESSDATESSDASREELARMVEETGDPTPEVKIGDRLRGKIVSIDDENTFVDYAGRAEARIATSELRDKNQQVVMRVGDSISATVSAVDDGVVLTLGRRRGVVHAAKLRVAFENKVPVQGSVKASNKGGFDVQIGGIRTFCPLSQIDRTYVEDPKAYIGKSFTFRVLRWENGGRNIVVTRRALLEEEAAEKAVETRKTLAVDAVLEGMVTRIQPFGAFIDIGGLEGLLHVSRMSYGRVEDPRKVVDVGQKISVRVLSIENEGTRKERISLGLADLGPDPWETLTGEHKEGDVVSGKVARLTDFGAFVQLAEGVDGLVHISEIANQRIQHPQEVLKVGDEVEVRILRIESEKRRVSLSIRQVSEEQPARPRREPRAPRRQESSPPSSGALTHTMADQLGALKKKLRDQ